MGGLITVIVDRQKDFFVAEKIVYVMFKALKEGFAALLGEQEEAVPPPGPGVSRAEKEQEATRLLRLLDRTRVLDVAPSLVQRAKATDCRLCFLFIEHGDDKDLPFEFVARLRSLSDEDGEENDYEAIDLSQFDWPHKEAIRCSYDDKGTVSEIPNDGALRSFHLWADAHSTSGRVRDDELALSTLSQEVELLVASFSLRDSTSDFTALHRHVAKLQEVAAQLDCLSGKIVLVVYAVNGDGDLFSLDAENQLKGRFGSRLQMGDGTQVAVISELDKISWNDFDRWKRRIEGALRSSRVWPGDRAVDAVGDAFREVIGDGEHVWMRDVRDAIKTALVRQDLKQELE